ncbi:MAG TPA: hypothetical protein VJ853_02560 [Thermoanaerobaculia bacterium]|nr:hypothetical protein [Thermoanaerobaculia bacterium]
MIFFFIALLTGYRLGFSSFGPVRIGMTPRQVERSLSVTLVGGPGEPQDCEQMHVASDPGISFMFESGKLTRFDIKDAHHKTISGLRVGATENAAKKIYGDRLSVSPHKYVKGGHYLTLVSADKKFALVIETDGKYVTAMRAGKLQSAQYVEGCS